MLVLSVRVQDPSVATAEYSHLPLSGLHSPHLSNLLPTFPLLTGWFSLSTRVTVFHRFRFNGSHAFQMKSEFSGLAVKLP